MFANALDLDADTPQQPERLRMDDPVIERPTPIQVSQPPDNFEFGEQ